jgi:hypothetical protein
MKQLRAVVGLAIVAGLLASGVLLGEQDTGTRFKGVLPPNWGKLGLSDKQKQDVYRIQTEFGEKIEALKVQIKQLEEQERAELVKVLTDEQKNRLKQILAEKAGLPEKNRQP